MAGAHSGVAPVVVLFPLLVVLVSLACAAIIARDWWRRPRPEKAAWLIAFVLFALAAAAEVAGALAGWTPLLARVYYAAGAILVVGFLGLGELYLLAPARTARLGPGVGLFLVAVAAALVSGAPVDAARLPNVGWHALERGPALVIFTVAVNTLGTLIVAGGALFTAWQFQRRGVFRHRMIGCLLIALGTLIVASGGTLTRLGRPEYLYLAMAAGISIIGAGYLETRRRDLVPAVNSGAVAGVPAAADIAVTASPRAASLAGPPVARPDTGVPEPDPAVGFISGLLRLDAATVSERCAFWSVPAPVIDRFDREQARRVWSLRLHLAPASQARLDALPAAAQVQLAELYFDVVTAPPPPIEPPRPAPILITPAPAPLSNAATTTPGERSGN